MPQKTQEYPYQPDLSKTCKLPKYQTAEWVNKLGYTNAMGYFTQIKKQTSCCTACNSMTNFADIMLNRRSQTLISTFSIDVKCEKRQNQAWVTEVRIVPTFGKVLKTWEVYEGGLRGTGSVLQCLDPCGSYSCKNPSDHVFVRMCVLDYMWFVTQIKNRIRKNYVVLGFSLLEMKVKVSRDRLYYHVSLPLNLHQMGVALFFMICQKQHCQCRYAMPWIERHTLISEMWKRGGEENLRIGEMVDHWYR